MKGGVALDLSSSILKDIRGSVGLTVDNAEFDNDLLPHINAAISKLNQNGIGNILVVSGESETWSQLQDPTQTDGNEYFQLVPLYVTLSTKLLFDPPPPSSVGYHSNNIAELLWRLKIAYEKPYTTTTTTDQWG